MCDELAKIWIVDDQNSDRGDTEDDNKQDDNIDDDFDDEDDKLLFCLDGNPLNELSTIQCSIELYYVYSAQHSIKYTVYSIVYNAQLSSTLRLSSPLCLI